METQNTGETQDFNKIADQSREKLQNEAAAQVKNKGGRPPGSKNKKGRENEPQIQRPASGEPSLSPGAGPLHHGEIMPHVDLEPLTKDAIKVPFSLWAFKEKEPRLELTDEESKTASFYLNRVVNLHFPEIQQKDAKTFSLYALALSVFSLLIKKSIQGLAFKREKMARAQAQAQAAAEAHQARPQSGPTPMPQTSPPSPAPAADGPTISATDFLGPLRR